MGRSVPSIQIHLAQEEDISSARGGIESVESLPPEPDVVGQYRNDRHLSDCRSHGVVSPVPGGPLRPVFDTDKPRGQQQLEQKERLDGKRFTGRVGNPDQANEHGQHEERVHRAEGFGFLEDEEIPEPGGEGLRVVPDPDPQAVEVRVPGEPARRRRGILSFGMGACVRLWVDLGNA